ncbi:hypothetical protein DFI02_1011302 [Rhizobium sp. PP-F2F-G20b]|nr:hypothetical protein DFI02_1011302 [Rhizobium sp. PP-F2F-G20b]
MAELPKFDVPQAYTQRLRRESDGNAFFIVFDGGLRANQAADDAWFVEPVFDQGPTAKGVMSFRHMRVLLEQHGLSAIAFHNVSWFDGAYSGGWSPIVPGRTNHMIAPSDVWSQIAANLSKDRIASELRDIENPNREDIARIVDARSEEERLARSISLSLRNMDSNIEHVADFYHEQLSNLMHVSQLDGQHVGTMPDQMLYAQVQAFYMHLGAARDYLAALIAARIGRGDKINAMNKLVEKLRIEDLGDDNLFKFLVAKGYLRKKDESHIKLETAGWLAEMTVLRNTLIHHRPYGDRFIETSGFASTIDAAGGLYRYHRLFIGPDGTKGDVLDVMLSHYRNACSLLLECADRSGYDLSVLTLTDADLVFEEISPTTPQIRMTDVCSNSSCHTDKA